MEPTCLWKGSVEKRGNDVVRRWMKRELVVYPNECLYFSPGSGELRGYIPYAQSTTISVDGNIVKIKTIGREHKKSSEKNGRSFEFRIRDSKDRTTFVRILKTALNTYRSQQLVEAKSGWGEEHLYHSDDDEAVIPYPPDMPSTYHPPPGAVRLLPGSSILGGTQGLISSNMGRPKKKLAAADVKAHAAGRPMDLDDYYESLTVTSALTDPPYTEDDTPHPKAFHRLESYHDMGEDDMLDITDVHGASEAGGGGGVTEEALGFLLCSKLFVAYQRALDKAWEELCGRYTPASSNPLLHLPTHPYTPPNSPHPHPSRPAQAASGPSPHASSNGRGGGGKGGGVHDLEAVTLTNGHIHTIDDLYRAVLIAKPFFDNILRHVVQSVTVDDAQILEEIKVRSRVCSPNEITEKVQLCGVYNFFTSSCASTSRSPLPPYTPALVTQALPEACMHNILTGKITCSTGEQIVAVVGALIQTGMVIFVDNRFVSPLGSPPERDPLVMPLEGAYYCEGYQREVRVLLDVKCTVHATTTSSSSSASLSNGHAQPQGTCTSFRCEVIVTLQDFDDIMESFVHKEGDVFEEASSVPSGAPLFNTLLRPFFLQFRSWCMDRADLGLDISLPSVESSPSVVKLYYQRDVASRVDMLHRVAALSREEYQRESDMFMVSMESAAYLDHPTTYRDDNFFMCWMQEVCGAGDVVVMRALCSLFCQMGMYAGAVAVQRQLLRYHSNAHPTNGGEVAMSMAIEGLSCALLLEGTVDSIQEGVVTSEESLTMREAFHMQEKQAPSSFAAYGDITALSDAMLLHARLHYEAGDVKEVQSILERALHHGALGSRRSLAIVKHHMALFYVQEGAYKTAMSIYEEVLTMYRQFFGSRHPLVAGLLLDMCLALIQAGEYDQAEKVGKKGLSIRIDSCGMKHPSVAEAFLLVTPALNMLGKAADAKAYIEKAVHIRKDYYGWRHSEMAECFLHYGVVCKRMGNVGACRTYLDLGMKVKCIERQLI